MDLGTIIIIALIGIEIVLTVIPKVQKWLKPDLACDLCGKVKDLSRSHDLKYWVCKGCRVRYKKEVQC